MRVTTDLFGTITVLDQCVLVGATESIGFVTAVSEMFDGSEERTPFRDSPKQSIKLDYFAVMSYFDVEYQDIRRKWGVPFDQEIQEVGNIAQDAVTINVDTAISDFRDSSLALLRNADGVQVVEIDTVESGVLNLLNPIDAMTDASISPLRVCYIKGDIGRKNNLTFQSSSVEFLVVDTTDLEPLAASNQYKGLDLYLEPIYTESGSLDTTISKQQDLLDYDIGGFSSRTRHTVSKVAKNWNFRTQDRIELFNFKRFLFQRQGMFKAFYMPTFEDNIILKSTGFIGNELLVEYTGYIERTNLALKINGAWQAVEATSISAVNLTTTKITLSSSIGVDASLIQRISYLGLYRLNSDTIEIKYNGNGYATSQMPIMEIG